MLQSVSSVFVVYRHKTLTGSLDPTHANGMEKPCIAYPVQHSEIALKIMQKWVTQPILEL